MEKKSGSNVYKEPTDTDGFRPPRQNSPGSFLDWYYNEFKLGIKAYRKRLLKGTSELTQLPTPTNAPWDLEEQLLGEMKGLTMEQMETEENVKKASEDLQKIFISAKDKARSSLMDMCQAVAHIVAFQRAFPKVTLTELCHKWKIYNDSLNPSIGSLQKKISLYKFIKEFPLTLYSGIGWTTLTRYQQDLEHFLKINIDEALFLKGNEGGFEWNLTKYPQSKLANTSRVSIEKRRQEKKAHKTSLCRVWTGRPYPLGATITPSGVNFAIFSENATAVDLCLFECPESTTETVRIRLTEMTNMVWHCLLPDISAGQLYGYRVFGPFQPEKGHRFNDTKLLLDPCAKAINGLFKWCPEMFGYQQGSGVDADIHRDHRDNAFSMPKSVVISDEFDWGDDKHPEILMEDSIIYEVHVKGFSKNCPEIPEKIRGSYAALGSDYAIQYLKILGVTAVELLPIQSFTNDQFLVDKGLTNYWGYNSINFFSPHCAYSSSGTQGEQVLEFKQMVKNLHAAGIEVILDVVYNHTGEGNHMGPTLCFRGVDNAAYYRLVPQSKRYCMDYTGTGNTLNLQHPRVLQHVLDSLRYWVQVMHVDGFRFDLAAALGREELNFSKGSGFFDAMLQDPILSQVKLIAEPWDVGEGGYQVGNFPIPWAEWNGKFRDCARSYWKGDLGTLGELAYRLTGSSDLFDHEGRHPHASVNFITAHDGFTLYDTVAYNSKHNEANGENNEDGHNDNRSWNCGCEGNSTDEGINQLRKRQLRNMLTTLLLSQGVPMMLGGDEFGRSQKGNNNSYCQDNDISWYNWSFQDWQKNLIGFTSKLVNLRKKHPVFRRPKFLKGRTIHGVDVKDLMWLDVDGTEMTAEKWNLGYTQCLGMMLSGDTTDVKDIHGDVMKDDTFLLLFNAYHGEMKFVLPGKQDIKWAEIINTEQEDFLSTPITHSSGDEIKLIPRSMCVLQLFNGSQQDAHNVTWKQQQTVLPTAPPKPAYISGLSRDLATSGPARSRTKAFAEFAKTQANVSMDSIRLVPLRDVLAGESKAKSDSPRKEK